MVGDSFAEIIRSTGGWIMGFYTHGWAESHGGIHDVGREASKPIEAEMALRAKADRERTRAASNGTAAGYPARRGAGGRTSGERKYGEAAVETGIALLGPTPVPGAVVDGFVHGFLGVVKSILTLDFH
ncbi:hypothetical protein ACFXHA_13970 [Nocardia sp. NPDC059240]|uniref:hypothetical protein n=1 Tax=Nocardia sp. NPDC059240 TaxID=3346786 RepID=UPI0036881022